MEDQAIIAVITEIFSGTDERNWKKVEDNFAESVLLDYHSMSGEKPSTLSPTEITMQWKSVLPGFDETRHTISGFEVTVKNNSAKVTNSGRAIHKLNISGKQEEWIVEGNYFFELKKISGEWKVSSMKFIKEKISGNLELPKYAQEKVKNTIMKKKVSFESEGLALTGILHLPPGFQENTAYKAVIVTGSWITVKEQMPQVYATKLAQLGYVALTFDFRNYGESEGQPRNYEVPQMKAEDITNAANYLKSLPFIEKNKIFGLPICASSGYMAEALANGAPIKAITFVAPWLHNNELVEGLYGGHEGVEAKIKQSITAKKKFAETGQVDYVPATSTSDKNAAMFGDFEYYTDAERGAIKEWGNQFAVMAWQAWLQYDPIAFAGKVNIPVLIIHSKSAAIPDGAELFYKKLKSTKNIIWVDKATQFDFYDQEPFTTDAAKAAAGWFNEN